MNKVAFAVAMALAVSVSSVQLATNTASVGQVQANGFCMTNYLNETIGYFAGCANDGLCATENTALDSVSTKC